MNIDLLIFQELRDYPNLLYGHPFENAGLPHTDPSFIKVPHVGLQYHTLGL